MALTAVLKKWPKNFKFAPFPALAVLLELRLSVGRLPQSGPVCIASDLKQQQQRLSA